MPGLRHLAIGPPAQGGHHDVRRLARTEQVSLAADHMDGTGDSRQQWGERMLIEPRHRAGGVDIAFPGADRLEAPSRDLIEPVAGGGELLARVLLEQVGKGGEIASDRLDAVTEECGGAAADDRRGAGDRGPGHQVGPLGRSPEHHRAAERVADAVGRTRQRFEEGNQVSAQLFQRALGLSEAGFTMSAKVVRVGREVAQPALDVRPAVPVLRKAVDHDRRRPLSGTRVADIDIAEPDLHAASPGPAPLPAAARRSALRIFPAGVIGIASTMRRTSGQWCFGKRLA